MNEWDRLPAEPWLWYDRFITYCLLGPQRTLRQAWRHHNPRPAPNNRSTPGGWTKVAKRDNWKQRACAWDQADNAPTRAATDFRNITASRKRAAALNDLIEDLTTLFRSLHLAELRPHDALPLLPTLRPLLRDLLYAEHRERFSMQTAPALLAYDRLEHATRAAIETERQNYATSQENAEEYAFELSLAQLKGDYPDDVITPDGNCVPGWLDPWMPSLPAFETGWYKDNVWYAPGAKPARPSTSDAATDLALIQQALKVLSLTTP